MEENKKKEKKEIKSADQNVEKVKKLSYEELENVAKQISVQLDAAVKENKRLKEALQQNQMANLYTQMEFMFKVVENYNAFDADFVQKCIDAIQNIMLNNPEEDKQEEKND